MYRGRACWSVVGHGKAKGLIFSHRASNQCPDMAATRYLMKMFRVKGVWFNGFSNWF